MLYQQIILFTVNKNVLERVSHHDPVFQSDHTHTQLHDHAHSHHTHEVHRPKTAHAESESEESHRPFTSSSTATLVSILADMAKPGSRLLKSDSFIGTVVEVILSDNWGDSSYIGLTGIALLGAGSRQPIALRPDQLTLSVTGGSDEGFSGRQCLEVARLVDGVNVTTNAVHMWACPVPRPSSHLSLTFTLDTPISLAGLRVWNYNQSMEDSYKGVRKTRCDGYGVIGSPLLTRSSLFKCALMALHSWWMVVTKGRGQRSECSCYVELLGMSSSTSLKTFSFTIRRPGIGRYLRIVLEDVS